MAKEYADIWLCVECMFFEVNGELPEDEERAQEIEEGFDRLGEVSSNFGSSGDEEGGYRDFSWTPCACCGTRFGGSRYRFALWLEEE